MTYATTADFRSFTKLNTTDVSDTDAATFLTASDAEVKSLTGQDQSTSQSVTEYYDGRKRKNTNDSYNYVKSEYESVRTKDFIVLDNRPVTALTSVYFLNRDINFSHAFSDDGGVFTDNTTEANLLNGTAFNAFAAVPVANDALYLTCGKKFSAFTITHGTLGTGSPVVAIEFYNGTSWTAVSGLTDGTSALTANGKVSFTLPATWATTAINSVTDYWIRIRVTTAYTIAPTILQIVLDHDTVIETEIDMNDVTFYSNGKVVFLANAVQDGYRNIKVTYSYGATSVPVYVTEMACLFAGIRAMVALSGGNYDTKDSYAIGPISVNKAGKQVRISETINIYRERIKELKKLTGSRFNMAVVN